MVVNEDKITLFGLITSTQNMLLSDETKSNHKFYQ